MGKRPTYEELEQRVAELEKEVLVHQKAEESLQEIEEKYRLFWESANEGVILMAEHAIDIVSTPTFLDIGVNIERRGAFSRRGLNFGSGRGSCCFCGNRGRRRLGW